MPPPYQRMKDADMATASSVTQWQYGAGHFSHSVGVGVLDVKAIMAECLTWKDLSEATLVEILEPKETSEVRRNVRDAFRIQDDGDELAEIVTDLYYNTIMFAHDKKFTMEKMSTLVSIVRVIHEQSTVGRMPMDKSWEKTKQILLTHSIQRPPFSVAIFSLADLQAITHYLLHTLELYFPPVNLLSLVTGRLLYFRHYKMYQYAFMPTFILNIETLETGNFVELPPYIFQLKCFAPQDEYDEEQERIRKEKEDEEARLADEARLAAEEERKREIEAAYLAAIPDEITQKVIDALAKHLETMKAELNEQIHVTEEKVTKKIVDIDARRPPPKPGSLLGGSIRGSQIKPGSIRGSLKQ